MRGRSGPRSMARPTIARTPTCRGSHRRRAGSRASTFAMSTMAAAPALSRRAASPRAPTPSPRCTSSAPSRPCTRRASVRHHPRRAAAVVGRAGRDPPAAAEWLGADHQRRLRAARGVDERRVEGRLRGGCRRHARHARPPRDRLGRPVPRRAEDAGEDCRAAKPAGLQTAAETLGLCARPRLRVRRGRASGGDATHTAHTRGQGELCENSSV